MRRNYKVPFLALLAVLALSAIGSASASAALPELHAEKSAYPITFTGTSSGTPKFQAFGAYECSKEGTITGTIAGPNEITKVTVSYPGSCRNLCVNTLEWKELKGRIGYTNATKKEVGLLLEPTGELLGTCKDWNTLRPRNFRGSVIGEFAALGGREFLLKYQQSGSKQQLTKFAGEELAHTLEMTLLGFGETQYERVGLASTTTFKTSAPVELRK